MWIKIVNPNSRKQIPDAQGVYCFFELVDGVAKIIYIGSTRHLQNRIAYHTKFDHPYREDVFVKIKKCDDPVIIEKRLIKRLCPSLNHLVDGKIVQRKSTPSAEWVKKLDRQREYREKKKADQEWLDRQRRHARECKRRQRTQIRQSDEYKYRMEQMRVTRMERQEFWESDEGQHKLREKNAKHALGQYRRNPGYYREKKNLFKIFGTKQNISYPLRKSIALVHLGRRMAGGCRGNRMPIDRERAPQIINRINTGDTYAAYE